MRPVKLKQHSENVHPLSKNKDKSFFEQLNKALKKMRLDSSGGFCQRNNKLPQVSI